MTEFKKAGAARSENRGHVFKHTHSFKKITALFLVLVLLVGNFYRAQATDVLYISTVQDFISFAQTVNGGDNFAGRTVRLTTSISLDIPPFNTDNGWIPLANFSGVLDGGGYIIYDLYINRTALNTGLIANLHGTVKNLGISNASVTGVSTVGGIAGRLHDGGTVQNIFVCGRVSGTGNSVGGIAGRVDYGAFITNSFTMGEVISVGTNAGGLAGLSSGDISHSFSTATISAEGAAGGLVGNLTIGGGITNSAALNPSINAAFGTPAGAVPGATNAGRIVAAVGLVDTILSNNIAYDGMAALRQNFGTAPVGVNGTGVTRTQIYSGYAFASLPVLYARQGFLPAIPFHAPVPLPPHLGAVSGVVDISALYANAFGPGFGWSFDGTTLSINDGTGIELTGDTSGWNIAVSQDATASITLRGVAQQNPRTDSNSPIILGDGAELNLMLAGENILAANGGEYSIYGSNSATLTIGGDGELHTDSLRVGKISINPQDEDISQVFINSSQAASFVSFAALRLSHEMVQADAISVAVHSPLANQRTYLWQMHCQNAGWMSLPPGFYGVTSTSLVVSPHAISNHRGENFTLQLQVQTHSSDAFPGQKFTTTSPAISLSVPNEDCANCGFYPSRCCDDCGFYPCRCCDDCGAYPCVCPDCAYCGDVGCAECSAGACGFYPCRCCDDCGAYPCVCPDCSYCGDTGCAECSHSAQSKVTVTFNLGGGHLVVSPPALAVTTMPSLTVFLGAYIGVLPRASTAAQNGLAKAGHRFAGWFTDVADENTRWHYNTPVTEDTTLHVLWIPVAETFRTGSVTGSGRVASSDATLIARWLICRNIPGFCPLAADLNGDGEVTIADLILLARWLVGHDVQHLIAK